MHLSEYKFPQVILKYSNQVELFRYYTPLLIYLSWNRFGMKHLTFFPFHITLTNISEDMRLLVDQVLVQRTYLYSLHLVRRPCSHFLYRLQHSNFRMSSAVV